MNSKILIIEDDAAVSQNISTLLEEENYNVIKASNGFKGIDKAITEKPDLIICDIMMPGLDGYKVKEELNSNESTFDIPLLFLTAKTEIEDLRHGMGLGADDYLFKPFKAVDLLGIIKLRLNKKKRIIAKLIEQNSSQNTEDNHLRNDDSILLNLGFKSKFVKINLITSIQASSQYSNIVLNDGQFFLFRKSLNYWENLLPKNIFIRIHRSTIVNINHVVKIEKTQNNSQMIYINGNSEPFVLSRRYSAKLTEKIKSI
jgi:DNA-binding LytR/AlgR family response regulator